jgi:hypothetical protein
MLQVGATGINQPTHWRSTGEWRYGSNILDPDTAWRWVVSFTPLPLYFPRETLTGVFLSSAPTFIRHPQNEKLLKEKEKEVGVGLSRWKVGGTGYWWDVSRGTVVIFGYALGGGMKPHFKPLEFVYESPKLHSLIKPCLSLSLSQDSVSGNTLKVKPCSSSLLKRGSQMASFVIKDGGGRGE